MRRLLALVAVTGALGLGAALGAPPSPVSAAVHATPTPTTPSPTPAASASPTATASTSLPTAGQIIATAVQYLGYPYAYIGDDPNTGFSCIGFVHYVFAQHGVYVPEELNQAYASAPHVDESNLQPGDLVFFQNTYWSGNSHVDIYIGNGKMIGADSVQTGVQYDTLSDQYWQDHYLGATRPLSDPSGTPINATPTPTASDGASATPTSTPTPQSATPSASSASGSNLSIKAGTHLAPRHTATVYSGPGTAYMSIDSVTTHTSLTAVQTQGQWVNVSYDDGNQYGWIHGPDLDLSRLTAKNKGAGKGNSHRTAARTPRQEVKGFRATKGSRTLVVTATILFVRERPDRHARILRRVRSGDRVLLLGQSSGWDYIEQRDHSRGWVDAHWVT